MSIIETERLILRPFLESDFEAAINLYSNGLSQQISESHPEVFNKVMSEMFSKWLNEYKEGLDIRWAITLKDCDTIVGDIIVNKIIAVDDIEEAEIGYNILENHWNNGYATEAAKAVIQNLFERGISRIVAWYEPDNPTSGRVMEKCGMKYVCKEAKNLTADISFETIKYMIENIQKTLDNPENL